MADTMVEHVAKAIYGASTKFDGDQIAVHLGQSYAIDGSCSTATEEREIVMSVCVDAAWAAIAALSAPPKALCKIGADAYGGDPRNVDSAWNAMIDAILQGDPAA